MDVGTARPLGGIDLHYRPDQHEMPDGPRIGDGGEEGEIEPLVEHRVMTDSRPRDLALVVGLGERGARLAEMRDIDAARKGMDIRVPAALRLIKAVAAGEDDIGPGEQ